MHPDARFSQVAGQVRLASADGVFELRIQLATLTDWVHSEWFAYEAQLVAAGVLLKVQLTWAPAPDAFGWPRGVLLVPQAVRTFVAELRAAARDFDTA